MSEVTDFLCAEGIPDSFPTILADMSLLHAQVCTMYITIYNNYIFTENHIDGIALVALPEDLRNSSIQASSNFKWAEDAY